MEKKVKKVRVDFSAHYSVVVAVEDSYDYYDKAANIAEKYMNGNSVYPMWDVDDDGVYDVDDSEKAVNDEEED